MSTTVSPDSEGRRALLKAISLLSLLFVGLHQTYVRLADWIHNLSPATEAARVNPWLRRWVGEHDGNETVVMMVIVTAFLLAGYAIVRWLPKIPWFPWWPVQLLCLVPVAAVLRQMNTSNWTPPEERGTKLLVVALGLGVALLGWIATRVTEQRAWLGRGLLAIGFVVMGALVLLSARAPWSFDYGFFIGPANKLAQGEALGSFYIQYNLIETYLFRLMMAFGLRLHQMQAVLGLFVVLWIGLYYWLATRLMENRFIVFLFVTVLLLVRVAAIDGGPTLYPQVGTLRMDLWVVLALVLDRFGVTSRVTAAAFALGYLADNTFGFVFFAFYGAVLAVTLAREWRAGKRPTLKHVAGLGAPLLVVLLFQLWVFKGFTNPAGKIYQDVHLGFLPITLQSMFWGIAWVLLASFGPVSLDKDEKRRTTSFFLFAFAAGMLVYFYGRSHDHNLLNLSGIWIFILFVALDRLAQAGLPKLVGPLLSVMVLCLSLVGVWKAGETKWGQVKSRVSRGVFLEPSQLDLEIDANPNALAAWRGQKVFLFSLDDSYLNYRYGLRQEGFFAPFFASVYAESTAQFVLDELQAGYKVLLLRTDPNELLALNATAVMLNNHQRFVLVQSTPGPATPWTVLEVTLVR